jgi:hypothetical protein
MIIYDLSSKPDCHHIDILNRRPIGFSPQMDRAITENCLPEMDAMIGADRPKQAAS